eukprot:389421-Prymnesium_polylepis.1
MEGRWSACAEAIDARFPPMSDARGGATTEPRWPPPPPLPPLPPPPPPPPTLADAAAASAAVTSSTACRVRQ